MEHGKIYEWTIKTPEHWLQLVSANLRLYAIGPRSSSYVRTSDCNWELWRKPQYNSNTSIERILSKLFRDCKLSVSFDHDMGCLLSLTIKVESIDIRSNNLCPELVSMTPHPYYIPNAPQGSWNPAFAQRNLCAPFVLQSWINRQYASLDISKDVKSIG